MRNVQTRFECDYSADAGWSVLISETSGRGRAAAVPTALVMADDREADAALMLSCFFFQAEDGIRDLTVTGVQTCALPICSGTSAGIADAIRWAADHGARVLNLSLGGGSRSANMANAVAYARRKGCVVVAAAGNSGSRGVHYPAAYPGAIAVSAVGPQGRLAPYSSFGPEVRIAAPGGDKSQGEEAGVLQETIDPSDPGGKGVYRWFQGTSMATPHVAGAAALVASLGVTDPRAIERLIASAADGGPPEQERDCA